MPEIRRRNGSRDMTVRTILGPKLGESLTGALPGRAVEPALPDIESIRLRAFQHYLRRGESAGNSEDDWLSAERELREEMALRPPAPRDDVVH